ncbi:hypothetical protein ACZ87_03049 [Candidatus Erwinia dacicola]|uniref:Uncharacterized protein n=1 Tax=Candidatus Erwinia dacicola TaxID=252393 RepID=A0A328TI62_9GAMM|nr:hypothetical protein ACZ87_03049 [Candidatus Erwinia dacicola]
MLDFLAACVAHAAVEQLATVVAWGDNILTEKPDHDIE